MYSDLASLDAFAAFLGRELTPAGSGEPATSEEQALQIASDAVRSLLGYPVTREEELYVLDGTGSTVVRLPAFPLLAVSEVRVAGELLDDSAYAWSHAGWLTRTDGRTWGTLPRNIEVSATTGFDMVPPAITGVVLSLAARMVDGSAGIKQETIGSYSVTYQNPSPTLQAGEIMALDHFRLR